MGTLFRKGRYFYLTPMLLRFVEILREQEDKEELQEGIMSKEGIKEILCQKGSLKKEAMI